MINMKHIIQNNNYPVNITLTSAGRKRTDNGKARKFPQNLCKKFRTLIDHTTPENDQKHFHFRAKSLLIRIKHGCEQEQE